MCVGDFVSGVGGSGWVLMILVFFFLRFGVDIGDLGLGGGSSAWLLVILVRVWVRRLELM